MQDPCIPYWQQTEPPNSVYLSNNTINEKNYGKGILTKYADSL